MSESAVISLTALAGRGRVGEQVEVLVDRLRLEVDGHDPHRGDVGRLDGLALRVRAVVGHRERRLHDADQRPAVGRDGEALHALVLGAQPQLDRQRVQVSTLWPLPRPKPVSAPHGESRSISLPFLSKCVMNGPYSSETQKRAVRQGDQALGVVAVVRVERHRRLRARHGVRAGSGRSGCRRGPRSSPRSRRSSSPGSAGRCTPCRRAP